MLKFNTTRKENNMAKTARQFSKKEIYDIAVWYATSYHEISAGIIADEYMISEATCRKLLDKAVILNVVNDKIVELMAAKAGYNSQVKAGTGGKKCSERHYDMLKAKRASYLPSKKEIIALAKGYAKSAQTKEQYSQDNYITKQLLDRIIYKAIIENLVNDKTVEELKIKSVKRYGFDNVQKFWKRMLYYREENKKRG